MVPTFREVMKRKTCWVQTPVLVMSLWVRLPSSLLRGGCSVAVNTFGCDPKEHQFKSGQPPSEEVMKQVDKLDLKSSARKSVWVRLPPSSFIWVWCKGCIRGLGPWGRRFKSCLPDYVQSAHGGCKWPLFGK